MNHSAEQQQIANWFDQTYRTRGEWYLRPLKAYYIYLELLRAQAGEKLLDVACGLGRLLEAGRAYGCALTGIDISKVAVDKARTKVPEARIYLANAEQLPFDDSHFEMITCLGSLERMIHLHKVLAELHRVGQPQARYCFLVRNAQTSSWNMKRSLGLLNKKGHQGANTLAGWTGIFEKAGFVIEEILPDQYPLQRRRYWSSLGMRPVDFREVIRSDRPLTRANEFLFLLRKK